MAADAEGAQQRIVASAPVLSQREGLRAVGRRQNFVEFNCDIRDLHSGAGACGQRKLVGLIVDGGVTTLRCINVIPELKCGGRWQSGSTGQCDWSNRVLINNQPNQFKGVA